MWYTLETEPDRPRDPAVARADNPDTTKKWQPDVISFEQVSGEPARPGATSRLLYRMGTRDVEMIETVTQRNLPEMFAGTYESDSVWIKLVNRFEEAGPDKTNWTVEMWFRCTKPILRLMMLFMPGAFKRKTSMFMKRFKDFSEAECANGKS